MRARRASALGARKRAAVATMVADVAVDHKAQGGGVQLASWTTLIAGGASTAGKVGAGSGAQGGWAKAAVALRRQTPYSVFPDRRGWRSIWARTIGWSVREGHRSSGRARRVWLWGSGPVSIRRCAPF